MTAALWAARMVPRNANSTPPLPMRLEAIALALLAVFSLTQCTTPHHAGHEEEFKSAVSMGDALTRLKAGNKRYTAEKPATKQDASELRGKVAADQKPFAVVLCCADSRTPPEVIFDQEVGDIFVCRVAGGVADAAVMGSIEYALQHVSSHPCLIVVLGHSSCGAVKAALAGGEAPKNTKTLLSYVSVGGNLPATEKPTDPARVAAAVTNNASHQAQTLVRKSDVIRKLVNEGKVRIAPAVYDLNSGEVTWQ